MKIKETFKEIENSIECSSKGNKICLKKKQAVLILYLYWGPKTGGRLGLQGLSESQEMDVDLSLRGMRFQRAGAMADKVLLLDLPAVFLD